MNRRLHIAVFVLLALLCSCKRAGKTSPEEPSGYDTLFTEQTQEGVFSLKDEYSRSISVFDRDTDQFTTSGRTSKLFYKALDLKGSRYLYIDFTTATSLSEGKTELATVTGSGIAGLGEAQGKISLEIVQVKDDLAYLRDNVNNIGYIITK